MIAGKPDESHLVLRIKGEEEPRMPQGGNNRMSDEAIAKIEQWVKEGAKLDAGIDPKKPIKSYAASPEQVVRNQIARLPAGERDKKTEAVGRERWKQANPKLKPEIVSGRTFPHVQQPARRPCHQHDQGHGNAIWPLEEADWLTLNRLGRKSEPLCFLQSEGLHRVCPIGGGARSRSRRSRVREAVDPATVPGGCRSRRGQERGTGGRQAAMRGRNEARKAEAEVAAADRTLAGVLTEALGTAAVASSGNAPRWLAEGLGSYMAAQVEPRSPYYRQLRQTAFANFDQGWKTRANEALGGGDQITADGVHSVGFALVEAMMSGMRRASRLSSTACSRAGKAR